jgi:formylglycine-generating enzyme required for sulfatase activity
MTAVATEVPGISHVDRLSSRYADMIGMPGGTFRMGSDKHYAEEAPAIA